MTLHIWALRVSLLLAVPALIWFIWQIAVPPDGNSAITHENAPTLITRMFMPATVVLGTALVLPFFWSADKPGRIVNLARIVWLAFASVGIAALLKIAPVAHEGKPLGNREFGIFIGTAVLAAVALVGSFLVFRFATRRLLRGLGFRLREGKWVPRAAKSRKPQAPVRGNHRAPIANQPPPDFFVHREPNPDGHSHAHHPHRQPLQLRRPSEDHPPADEHAPQPPQPESP